MQHPLISRFGAALVVALSYAFNAWAFAYLHWMHPGAGSAFSATAEPILGASILMLFAYTFVLLYWMSFVDMSAGINPGEDLRDAVVRRLYGPFWFVRWFSVDLFVGGRKKLPAEPRGPKTLREGVAKSIDRDCLIADIALLMLVPFLFGVTGLYSVPYNQPEFESSLLREATAYFLLVVWFNALAQAVLAAYCKINRAP
jgi:hypothetical protein